MAWNLVLFLHPLHPLHLHAVVVVSMHAVLGTHCSAIFFFVRTSFFLLLKSEATREIQTGVGIAV